MKHHWRERQTEAAHLVQFDLTGDATLGSDFGWESGVRWCVTQKDMEML